MNKTLLIFLLGFGEQLLYTFYLLAVGKYLIAASSILMFSYMIIYLWIINKIATNKDSIKLILVYAASCGFGNFIAMQLNLIK